MTTIFKPLLASLLLLIGINSHAASLSLSPGTLQILPGTGFSIDLVVSGLGDGAAPSAGVFDIDIGFDPNDLAFSGHTLGTGLGDLAIGEAIDVSFGVLVPGVVNVAEVSFLSALELDAAQPDSFVLATLNFVSLSGLMPGETTVVDILSVLAFGDSSGEPIAIDGTSGASITAIVPLPGAIWLFLFAIGVLPALRKCDREL